MGFFKGDEVVLAANEDEGWERQLATIIAVQENGTITVELLAPEDEDDDGLRDVTPEQIEFFWLIRWGQSGKGIVQARDGHEAFDRGNAWLEANGPLCGVRDALRLSADEVERETRYGTRRIPA